MPARLTAMVVLIAISIMINYVDRGNLSTAASLVKAELHISPSQLGFLLSAFFMTYVPMQPLVGWLSDRFTASRVLVGGFIVWSFATILSGLAGGFVALFACRLLLGLGESVSFPSMSKILAETVPEDQLGLANGIVQAGLAFGPAIGLFFGGMMIATYGWRAFFIGFGVASLVWVIAWMSVSHRHAIANDSARTSSSPPPRLELILKEPSLWGASLGHFCSNFILYFSMTWIPYYLVTERHWTLPQMATIAGSAYLLLGLSVVCSGAISDQIMSRGVSPTVVRKAAFAVGAAGVAACMIGVGYSNNAGSAAWLILNGIPNGILGLNIYSVAQTMAGPAATGRWVGIQNMLANIAGIIAPSLTGILVERTGSFHVPFGIAAAMALSSGLAWLFLVGPIRRIDWNARAITRAVSLSPGA